MPDKTKKLWAVYSDLNLNYRIGKILGETESYYWLKFREHEDAELWEKKYARGFDDPLKAIAYFTFLELNNHENHKRFTHRIERGESIQTFLAQFPSERKNIEAVIGSIGMFPNVSEYYKNNPNSSKSHFELRGF